MRKLIGLAAVTVLAMMLMLAGCGADNKGETPKQGQANGDAVGTLNFVANGEDFAREGMVSKDGWEMNFEHVYVTLAEVTGYQANPPYDAHAGGEVQAETKAVLAGTHTVDLTQGSDTDLVFIGKVDDAKPGHYNALSWQMVKAPEGSAQGYSIVFMGSAQKDGRTVQFTIKDEGQYQYIGGDYVGDERKGVLQAGGVAELEATFHFDHLFGDADTPLEDELNAGALGFEPIAALAQDGAVDVDIATLKSKLSAEDFDKLAAMLPTLGHVGEGHCHVVENI